MHIQIANDSLKIVGAVSIAPTGCAINFNFTDLFCFSGCSILWWTFLKCRTFSLSAIFNLRQIRVNNFFSSNFSFSFIFSNSILFQLLSFLVQRMDLAVRMKLVDKSMILQVDSFLNMFSFFGKFFISFFGKIDNEFGFFSFFLFLIFKITTRMHCFYTSITAKSF